MKTRWTKDTFGRLFDLRVPRTVFLFILASCAPLPAPGRPSASPAQGTAKQPAVIDVPAGTCPPAQTCETSLDGLNRQLHAHDADVRGCYSRYGLSFESELEVRAFVEVRTDGQQCVVMAQAANGTPVEICLAEAMAGWTLAITDEARPEHFMMRIPLPKSDLGVEGNANPLTPEGVAATVRGQVPQVRKCYERALKRRPDLQGKIVIGWTINRTGHVSLARVDEDTLRDDETAACVLHRVLDLTFVAPSGPVDISFPFVFQTADGA